MLLPYTLPKAARNKYSYLLLVQGTSCCTEKRVALRLWIGLSLVGYMRSKEDCGRRNISEQCDAARHVGGWVPLYLGVTQKLLQDLAGKGQPDSKSTWKRI